jgi:hypothetical protein
MLRRWQKSHALEIRRSFLGLVGLEAALGCGLAYSRCTSPLWYMVVEVKFRWSVAADPFPRFSVSGDEELLLAWYLATRTSLLLAAVTQS